MVSEQLTRDRILEAASSLFAEKSFQEVGIREIAKRAGCSHTTIYLYFKKGTFIEQKTDPTTIFGDIVKVDLFYDTKKGE